MATSGDRRIGVGRRGMTVLGKIPSPAVPKPINLPSQKLENKGLETNIEIVPRGTFSWGSTSRTATSANKSGTSSVVSSPPSSAGAWGGAAKLHALSGSGNEARNPIETVQPSSPGSGPRPSSAPTSTRAWGTVPKSQLHEESSGFNPSAVETWPQGPQELQGPEGPQRIRDTLPHKNIAEHSNRPMSADGSLVDKDRHPLPLHTGTSVHGRAGPGPGPGPGPVPGGFPHPGDAYSDHLMRQGMHPPVVHDVPSGLGVFPRPSHHEVYYPFGVPHYSNMKDRDIAVVAMINNAGYYGSYPPQVAHPEYMARPIYGNYGPRAPHPDQFTRPAHGNMGPRPHDLNINMGYIREGEFLSHEGEGFYDPRKEVRKYGDGYPGSGPAYGLDQSHRPQNMSGRHKFGHREGRDSANDFRDHKNPVSDRISAVPPPEGKITLLTKSPRLEEQSEGDVNHNPGKQGSEVIADTERPKNKADDKDEAAGGKVEVTDMKAGEHIEMKKNDGILTNKNFKETKVSELAEVKGNDDLLTSRDTKDTTLPKKDEHVLQRKVEHMSSKKDGLITPKMIEQITLPSVSAGFKKDELLVGTIVSEMASVSSIKVDSESNVECVSSTQKSHLVAREETNSVTEPQTLMNSNTFSECGSNVPKSKKKSDKFPIPISSAISVGEDHQDTSKEICNNTIAEISLKDENKAKGSRSYNQKAGKGWRPKSPIKGMNSSYGLHSMKVIEQDSNTGSLADVRNFQSSDRNDGNSFVRADQLALSSSDERSGRHNGKRHHKDALPVCSSGDLLKDNHEEKIKVVSTDGLPLKDDLRAKSRQGSQKVDKEWRPKSPAVEPHIPAKVSGIQFSKQDMADIESTDVHNKRTPEQEASDAYDYERQRAKLKEIAAQRAMQLRQEEEERAKEQKAKALAKLEELDRRTSALPTIVETSGHDNVFVNDDGVSKKLKQKQTLIKHTAKDSPLNDSAAAGEKDSMDKSIAWAVPTSLSNKSNVRGDVKREQSANPMVPSLNSKDSMDESHKNVKSQQFLASTYKEQRQHPRRVDSDRLHDAPSYKKLEVENKKNEGENSITRLPQQERRHATTEETKSTGISVKEDKRQQDLPVLPPAIEVHSKGGQPGRVASVQQRAKDGAHYRPRQMISPDINVPEEHLASISNLEKSGGMQPTFKQTGLQPVHLTSVLDSRHSSEKHGKLHGSWRQKHSSGESSFGVGGNSKHMESVSEGNLNNSVVKHNTRHVESVSVGKSDNSVTKPQVKQIDGISEENFDDSVLKPQFKLMESVVEGNFDNAVVKPRFKHIESVSEGNSDRVLGKPHEAKNARKHSSRAASETHKQGDIQSVAGANVGLELNSESAVSPIVSGPHAEEAKGIEAMKPSRSRNSWRQKNVNGHPSFKPSSLKEHPAEVKESHEDQLNIPSKNLEVPYSESSQSNNLRNDAKYVPKVSSGQPIRSNSHRSPRMSNAPGQGKPPQQASEDGPNVVGQGRYSGFNKQSWDNKHTHEIDNLLNTNQRDSDGLQLQAEEVAAYPEGNVQGYKQPRNKGYKLNRQYQPTSQGFKQTQEEQHSESKAELTYYGEHRHGRGREKSLRKAPLNGCLTSTSLELERKDSETAVKSEISY